MSENSGVRHGAVGCFITRVTFSRTANEVMMFNSVGRRGGYLKIRHGHLHVGHAAPSRGKIRAGADKQGALRSTCI
jgi:hypothetical protein